MLKELTLLRLKNFEEATLPLGPFTPLVGANASGNAQSRCVFGELGEGRKRLGEEAARRYARILRRCPQDVGSLDEGIRKYLRGSA